LVLATVVVVRSDAVIAVLFKACKQALYSSQRHRELGDDVVRVGSLLPALKKSSCEGASEERLA
jgi:hypothetical protein